MVFVSASGAGGPRDGPWAAISVGYFPGGGVAANVCALDTGGEARCWGSNYGGQSEAPPGRYTAVSTSGVHACALTDGGAIAYWGRGRAADAPPGRYTALSVRSDHSCAITAAGGAVCWGGLFSRMTPPDRRPAATPP